MEFLVDTPQLNIAVELAASGFVKPITPELVEDVSQHIVGDLVLRVVDDGTDVGFATFTFYHSMLYLEGVMIEAGHQDRSLARLIINEARHHHDVPYFGCQTQSPRMWCVGRDICDIWTPQLPPTPDADCGLAVATQTMYTARGYTSYLRAGCYNGAPLYGEKPVHRDARLQAWWDSLCTFEHGDAVVCAGRFALPPGSI